MPRALGADYPPLMLAQIMALRVYARDRGHTWKTRLWTEWMDATAEPLLHGLRNSHGSAWLDKLTLAKLPGLSEEENHAGQC